MCTTWRHRLGAAGLSAVLLLAAPTASAGPLSMLVKAAQVASKGKGVVTAGKLAAGGLPHSVPPPPSGSFPTIPLASRQWSPERATASRS